MNISRCGNPEEKKVNIGKLPQKSGEIAEVGNCLEVFLFFFIIIFYESK